MDSISKEHRPIYEAMWTVNNQAGEQMDKISAERLKALLIVNKRIAYYKSEHFCTDLVYAIAEKRSDLILRAKTLSEIREAAKEPKPSYNGATWRETPYDVPEEELILWSLTSMAAPLNEVAFHRYMALFEAFYGKKPEDF